MNPWDQKFKEEKFIYGTEPNRFLKEQVSVLKEVTSIACYAEGEGRNAVFLAQKGKQVTAFDYSKEGLQKTLKLAATNDVHVETQLTDLIEDELELNQFDGAVMIFGHFSKQHQYEVLDKIIASIKSGGVFLLELYEDGQLNYETGGPRSLDYLYNEQQLADWANNFERLHFYSGEVERIEGIGHTGVCKVLQLIIKK